MTKQPMTYIDGFVAAVPKENKHAFIAHAKIAATIFKECGALRIVDNWQADVPEGKNTSFPMAVQKKPNEDIVFSWVEWPSKQQRDIGMEKFMQDPRMDDANNPLPFDGKRMIYGGFDTLVDIA